MRSKSTVGDPAKPHRSQIPGPARLVRLWPWISSAAAALIINLIIGAGRQWNFRGISGFSTTNYGWLAFASVGGIIFAWRLADGRLFPLGLVRPLLASAVACAFCVVTVTTMGLIFLPEQSLVETVTTDAPGRSLPIGILVLAAGYVIELGKAFTRLARRP